MIIACPECEGPFEVRDGDIAELVQIECPHCRFRMILDFAAANDASLLESGMRMASGFRSAADYRRAAAGPAGVRVAEAAELPALAPPPVEVAPPPAAEVLPVAPAVQPAPAPAPAATERVSPPTAVPVAPPASMPTPVAPPAAASAPAARPPIVPIGLDDDDDANETIVRTPGVGHPTVIGMAPPPARAEITPPRATEADTEPARRRADALADAGVPEPIDAPPPARAETPAARPAPRPTPVTPPREPATTPASAAPRARPARTEAPAAVPDEPLEPAPRRSGAFGTVVLMILLLAVVGLTAASIVRKNTPDPRPLLEDLYRQYVAP
ncbi:MAG: hypothetical protein JNK45_24665 [Myxococcales bacterium]|nr:hypothetical protein [Myxococcales bacterium]